MVLLVVASSSGLFGQSKDDVSSDSSVLDSFELFVDPIPGILVLPSMEFELSLSNGQLAYHFKSLYILETNVALEILTLDLKPIIQHNVLEQNGSIDLTGLSKGYYRVVARTSVGIESKTIFVP